jgi:hypothetical protein
MDPESGALLQKNPHAQLFSTCWSRKGVKSRRDPSKWYGFAGEMPADKVRGCQGWIVNNNHVCCTNCLLKVKAALKRSIAESLPIPVTQLRSSPGIVATLHIDWLQQHLSLQMLAPILANAKRTQWGPNIFSALDLTTNTPFVEEAKRIARLLCPDYEEMDVVLKRVASIMGINQSPCIGVNRVGHITKRHSHAPMGVLNVLGGTNSRKRWRFWERDSGKTAEPCVVVYQQTGDVVWTPPGFFHEVTTMGGEIIQQVDVVAMHCVMWCLPKDLALQASDELLAGKTVEDQLWDKRLQEPRKSELRQVLQTYAKTPWSDDI